LGGKHSYRPALDGVRAVAIALVLVFHLGAPWRPGGYLGVSVFFTLSGFLITMLLLDERARTGRIAIRAFYLRRLRRLLPASLLCLLGIAVLAAAGAVAVRSDLRTGVLAAVFQAANWEQLLGHHSYADLFLAPSPIDHFWSLAVEEQFYWLWPVAIAGLTAVAARRSKRTVPAVLSAAFVLTGVGAVVTARTLGGDAAYFASWARFSEILAGAALAALLAGREVPRRAGLLAGPCLVAIVVLAARTPAGRGWAFGGGLPLFALLSAGLLLGVSGDGRVTRLLARETLPWIGRVSYGLYLFHWPVFTILRSAGVVEKLALTAAITVASYYLVERPIRTGRVLDVPVRYVQGAAISFVLVAAAVAVLVPQVHVEHRTTAPVVIDAALANAHSATTATTPTTASAPAASPLAMTPAEPDAPTTTTTAPPHHVVALFGDSIADWLLHDAAPTFARTDVTLVDAAIEGCDGAVRIPTARGNAGQILPQPADCGDWTTTYPPAAANPALHVDRAVLVIGQAPMLDRLVDGRWVTACDDMAWYVRDVAARVAYLRPKVGEVVLVMPSWGGEAASFLGGKDHLRHMGCIRAQLQAMADRIHLRTVDLAQLLCPAGPDGPCADLRRADGVHVDHDKAPAVLDWLLDRVL
jgi:peptidoglycan/LPS O-acetylase OafA/YrhL